MPEVEMCAKSALVHIRTFADKIKFNRSFSQDMLVTLFFRFLQVSSRSEYITFSIDRHCEEIRWLWSRYQSGHRWSRKSRSRCGRCGEINAKAEKGMRRLRIYAEATRMRTLMRTLSNWCGRYLQISMTKRPISLDKQKQKQQGGIGSAGVCCFKLLGFGLFESLLIGASWLAAGSGAGQGVGASTAGKGLRRRRADLTV